MKNLKTLLLLSLFVLIICSCKKDDPDPGPPTTVTDFDGNIYNILVIGKQSWMKENLKTKHYSNGDSISFVKSDIPWMTITVGACCNYNHDTNKALVYGKLYNYFAVSDPRNICPTGWHVPSDAEWDILTDTLGGKNVAGGKLKETGTKHWLAPNTGASNTSGFTALPGGYRGTGAAFFGLTNSSYFACATLNANLVICRNLNYTLEELSEISLEKAHGVSVRCLKD